MPKALKNMPRKSNRVKRPSAHLYVCCSICNLFDNYDTASECVIIMKIPVFCWKKAPKTIFLSSNASDSVYRFIGCFL